MRPEQGVGAVPLNRWERFDGRGEFRYGKVMHCQSQAKKNLFVS